MDNQEAIMIQNQIGYAFKNVGLLKQVFTNAVSPADPVDSDCKILLQIGNNLLNDAVMRYLLDKYSNVSDAFHCKFGLEELEELKENLIEIPSLANRTDELGFSEFIETEGGSDDLDAAQASKTNLFIALLGAIAVDSEWNYGALYASFEVMLNPDSFFDSGTTDYVRKLYEWSERRNKCIPWFVYYDRSFAEDSKVSFEGVKQSVPGKVDSKELQITCELKLLDSIPTIKAYGRTRNDARKQVCELAIDWISHHGMLYSIQDEIKNPNPEEAIEQLQLLSRRGYFTHPRFSLSSEDENREELWKMDAYPAVLKNATLMEDNQSNQIWKAVCHIDGKNDCCSYGGSIREAKRLAAYEMLMSVLGASQEEQQNRNV